LNLRGEEKILDERGAKPVAPKSGEEATMSSSKFLILAVAAAVSVSANAKEKPRGVDAAALLADPERPDADRARDADRKPAELIAFAGIRPGYRIAELSPGGGYFTRLLGKAVGTKGRVYGFGLRAAPAVQEWAKTHSNVTFTIVEPGTISPPEPVDLVWTTNNYHDFKNNKLADSDLAVAINKAAYRALKPGGIYLVADHEAGAGVGASATSTLHRIEGAFVRREIEAAGFQFGGESKLLRHPADDHSLRVQESGIRGKTDQFVYKFRKPRP
jgi:predicted methyltransferase